MEIRTASLQDLEDIAAVEAACFPVAEAATKAEFAERIQHYGDHFFLLYDKQKLLAFVDGFVTDEQNLTDEMYEKASLDDFWRKYTSGISKKRVCGTVASLCH